MKKTMLLLTTALVAILTLIGFRLAYNKHRLDEKNQPVVRTDTAIPVSVTRVAEGDANQALIKVGSLMPFKQANITASTAGKVTRIHFELGSPVREGAVLVQLDNRLRELSLAAMQLNVDKLKKDVTRYNNLLAGNATTELQANEINYNYQNAVNQVEQIKKQLSDANIKAPISGQIVKKAVEPGEYVGAGTVLGTIIDVSRLKVNVLVEESDVYQLRQGQSVRVTTEVLPGRVFQGHISYIAPQGTDEHNYPVEIIIADAGGLRAGTFVNADFSQTSHQKVLQMPRTALVESIKNPYVYVVEGQVAHQRKVNIGRELGENIEVLSGLRAGEVVVTLGQINLSEGKKVQVTK